MKIRFSVSLFKFYVSCRLFKIANNRVVLSTLPKIYHPLGLLALVTIIGNLFIQILWINNKKRDQELSKEDNMD